MPKPSVLPKRTVFSIYLVEVNRFMPITKEISYDNSSVPGQAGRDSEHPETVGGVPALGGGGTGWDLRSFPAQIFAEFCDLRIT